MGPREKYNYRFLGELIKQQSWHGPQAFGEGDERYSVFSNLRTTSDLSEPTRFREQSWARHMYNAYLPRRILKTCSSQIPETLEESEQPKSSGEGSLNRGLSG